MGHFAQFITELTIISCQAKVRYSKWGETWSVLLYHTLHGPDEEMWQKGKNGQFLNGKARHHGTLDLWTIEELANWRIEELANLLGICPIGSIHSSSIAIAALQRKVCLSCMKPFWLWAQIVTMTHSLRILPSSGVMSSFPWQKCLTLKPDLSSSEKMYPTKVPNIIEKEDHASSDDISNVYHQVW